MDMMTYSRRYDLTIEDLLKVARRFQLALLWQRDLGDFAAVQKIVAQGKKGMCAPIQAYYHADPSTARRMETYYQKTAGDMLQSFITAGAPHSHQFGHNSTQASVARWLQLPFLMLPKEEADAVDGWNEHSLADFHEMISLYLSPAMLHTYLVVSSNFYALCINNGESTKKCRHVDDSGRICWRDAVGECGFCKRHRWLV